MDVHALIADVERSLSNLKAHLLGDGKDLEKTAERDAGQLGRDAQTAAAPIVTEAEHDAAGLAAQAASDVSAAVGAPTA